ncbi:MAG: DNA polymerase III subunit delta [Marinifilaceae bacterium]|jgi:DNA polymerase-3 subunit delta|nr:DNA polymerase III subunit delta [Marinifilaceae bacterium]
MSAHLILSKLKNKEFGPIYFFMGEEEYFIDLLTDYMVSNCIDEDARDFNQTIVYGKDIKVEDLINLAKRFPMMSEKQLVLVREAQSLASIEKLANYVKSPNPSCILILAYKHKSLDKRTALYKALSKNAVLFESKKIYDNKVPEWIIMYLKDMSIKIDNKAAHLIGEYLGNDLKKITKSLEKILVNNIKNINSDHVEKYIGISKDFNIFELQKAIGIRDVYKANQIIYYFINNEKNNPFPLVLTMLFSYFSKLLKFYFLPNKNNDKEVANELKINPYFVKEYKIAAKNYPPVKLVYIIEMIRKYDLKYKGKDNLSNSSGELLKEFIYKILH